jgi:PAS domain S-box-containing protein
MGNICIPHLHSNKIHIEKNSLGIQEIGETTDKDEFNNSYHGCPVFHRKDKNFILETKETLYGTQILQISERKEMEHSNLSAFESVPLPIVSMNCQSKLVFINEAAKENFGYTAKEIIGKDISIILPQIGDLKLSEYLSGYSNQRVVKFKKNSIAKHKNGEIMSVIIQVVHDLQQGTLTLFIEKSHDLELNSPSLVKALVNLSMIPVIAVNELGIIVLASNSALDVFGYSHEELMGKNIRILMQEEIGNRHDEYIKRYLNTKVKRVVDKVRQLQALRKNGELFPIELKVTAIENDSNVVKYFVAYIRDMSRMLTSQEQEDRAKLADSIFPRSISIRLANKEQIHDKHIEVSVLFADIVGFTSISDRLSSETLVILLDNMFHLFDSNLLERYNLEKIKTIGDCYMLASGIPHEHPDHANNLVEAAFLMILLVKELDNKYSYILPSRLQIRIGINSGGLVAGIVGLKKPLYDVFGDTVNVASRMESTGKPGEIHISQRTYNLLREDLRQKFTERGIIEVKGKGSMISYITNLGS